jgi:hypothetical protein
MPFREDWSNSVYGFIQRAVDRLGGRLEAIRTDEIAMPGRINDQIMEAIRTANLVVADITGLNANVFWELGFARALERPCVIIMREGEPDAPFDIYDQRRVDYSPAPSEQDELHLEALLRGALGLS